MISLAQLASPRIDLQHFSVVRPIDPRLDQARAVNRRRAVDRALDFGFGRRLEAGHTQALRERRPFHGAKRHAGRRQPTRLLLDLDQAQRRVVEHDRDDAQSLARRRQQLARAHQQPAVAGERDDRRGRGRASAAPIAAGSANPIVDRPFEISMPFGSRTGQPHRRRKHVRAGVDGHAARRAPVARAATSTTRCGVRPTAGMSTRRRCAAHGPRDRVEVPLATAACSASSCAER